MHAVRRSLAILVLIVASCAGARPAKAAGPCSGAEPPAPSTVKVVWIWMENHHRDSVVGNRSAPYETAVARSCASAAAYRAVGSPSLPNYLGATSGSTQGISDDRPPASHPIDADNLFRQVRAAGGRAVTYAESMRGSCALASAGRYAVKHNPATYYAGADDRQACARDDVALGTVHNGALASALASDDLPRFSFVVPDICDDTHDCPVATGDRWLSSWLPAITGSSAYRSGQVAVFVVWDEPSPMPMLALARSVTPGTVLRQPIDHYSLLRTTEGLLGLPALGSAAQAAPFSGALRLG